MKTSKISQSGKAVLLAVVVTLWCCGPIMANSLTYRPITFAYNNTNFNRDSNFPMGNVTLGGVHFSIPLSNETGLNTWDSLQPAEGGGWVAGPLSVTIPVNVTGVQQVFTLINTSWGMGADWNAQLTFLDFYWSGGLTVHKVLTDGVDLRNWDSRTWVQTISPPTVNVYTDSTEPDFLKRIDMQTFDFTDPQFAGRILQRIVMTDNGGAWPWHDNPWGISGFNAAHRAYLYGVTVAGEKLARPVVAPFSCLLLD